MQDKSLPIPYPLHYHVWPKVHSIPNPFNNCCPTFPQRQGRVGFARVGQGRVGYRGPVEGTKSSAVTRVEGVYLEVVGT